jgi:hypothetical protein
MFGISLEYQNQQAAIPKTFTPIAPANAAQTGHPAWTASHMPSASRQIQAITASANAITAAAAIRVTDAALN